MRDLFIFLTLFQQIDSSHIQPKYSAFRTPSTFNSGHPGHHTDNTSLQLPHFLLPALLLSLLWIKVSESYKHHKKGSSYRQKSLSVIVKEF
jgi:hypothetical protein